MGNFDHPQDYRRYLRGTYAFRQAVEPMLSQGKWQVQPLLTELAADLHDLDEPLPQAVPRPALDGPAALVAAAYVLEGSALGARLIQRRAAALGFDATHGARHLARQTGDAGRWPRFLQWLEESRDLAAPAVTSARAVFRTALDAYGQQEVRA